MRNSRDSLKMLERLLPQKKKKSHTKFKPEN